MDESARPNDGEDRLRAAIEAMIRASDPQRATRLPTERALSRNFGMGRARVRRVLGEFERKGRITRNVGRGTFVAAPAETAALPDHEIETVSPDELMEVRLMIEPQIAHLLVRRASQADLAALRNLVEEGARAGSMARFEEIDHRFHLALTAAAKNAYLTGIIERMQAVRRSDAWASLRRRGLTQERRRLYQRHHEAILAALEARDAEAAEAALRQHLTDVRGNLWL